MKKILWKYSLLLIGSTIYTFYVALLLTPSNIGTGGILGISLALQKLFHFKLGITIIILNIPLFLFGFKLLGTSFALKSAVIVFVSSIMIDVLRELYPRFNILPSNDKLTSAIFCGIVSGLGMALIFMSGGSTGGLDISAKILQNKGASMPLSQILMLQDALVYVFVGIVLGPQSVMYAIIMSFIRSKAIDAIQEGLSSSRQCIIVCNNYKEIIDAISVELVRGVTVLNAVGGFSKEEKTMLFLVIQKNQLQTIKNIVRSCDISAFVAVSEVNEILGNYRERALSV